MPKMAIISSFKGVVVGYNFKNFEPFYLNPGDATPCAWVSEKHVTVNMNRANLDYQNSYRFSDWLTRAVLFTEAHGRTTPKRKIQSSNLALRFYKKDGWNYDDVQNCLVKGSARYMGGYAGNEHGYWVGEIGSVFSIDRLTAHEIYDFNGKLLKDDDTVQYIEAMNW